MSKTIPQKTVSLRVLHTSDWHLGKRLYHQNRYDEFHAFLVWLLESISQHHIDVLIVAGDIFDTMTPSHQAQALYYKFLGGIAKTCCQHVVIVAGNHDSPSFLDAPKAILHTLNIHVIGTASPNIHDELLVLRNLDNQPMAIVLAVPYLRDKDIRTGNYNDTISDKEQQTKTGIANHYHQLTILAKNTQKQLQCDHQKSIPMIATGHLFVTGASISSKDDGMRELYLGTLGQISADIFDDCIDYVALGHIHAPQMVGKQPWIRYSGSPLALGFGEAHKQKQVHVIDFSDTPTIFSLPVPTFQKMLRIEGDWHTISQALNTLITNKQSVWTEIIYTGDSLEPNLVAKIHKLLDNTQVQALNIQNKTLHQKSLHQGQSSETLNSLSPTEVFERLLQYHQIDTQESYTLQDAYQVALNELHETDTHF